MISKLKSHDLNTTTSTTTTNTTAPCYSRYTTPELKLHTNNLQIAPAKLHMARHLARNLSLNTPHSHHLDPM
jgi:hypothetical protein